MYFLGGFHVSFRKCNLELPECTWLVAWFVALLVVTKSIGGYPLVHVFVDPSFSLVSLRFQHGVYQKTKCYHTWKTESQHQVPGFFDLVNQDLNFRLDGEMVNFPLALVPSIVCRFQLSLWEFWLICSHVKIFNCLLLKPMDFQVSKILHGFSKLRSEHKCLQWR